MPPAIVIHTLARATGRVPGLRRVPLVKLLAVAEVALLTRDHVNRLTGPERRRLLSLVRASRGGRRRLTEAEHGELEALLVKLAPRELIGDSVGRLSPVPLPRRLLYGRSRTP
jgi:hypothetical protein